ncbi:MAG: uroporphyrinogen-III C-methyltransferase [Desulfamplus sp.]|nr:uroporphyrinogen-III C-methyltransferase [Desulfamplus sp.]
MTNIKKGKVYLIGAGPGDPQLITIKGMECIKKADVVVYDYLAAPALLKYARKDTQIIYVGKKGGDHTMSQEKINQLLVDKGKQGLVVSRLKGGDPFIFGRGGEEAEALIDADVLFEVVPGVTSAVAAPAYAGIPLTHRDYTSSVSLITGHEDPLKDESSIRWDTLAKSGSTLVFFMGVKNLPNICEKLIENGKSPDTPVALVRWGTTPKQQTVSGTLANIVERVAKAKLKPPSLIVVGEVVSLREKMKWFENRPFHGKRIVVTRAREQASDLVAALTELGAECIEIPTIKVMPPSDNTPLEMAIENINTYDWLIFTSVNGVKFFFDTLFRLGKDVRILGHLQFACIGPVTKEELKSHGIICDVLPESYRAESIVDAFQGLNNQGGNGKSESADIENENIESRKIDIKGKRILLPRAKEARSVLPEELTKMGAVIDEVTTYITEQVTDAKDELLTLLENANTDKTKENNDNAGIDIVTFTSSSTVKNFKALLPQDKFSELMKGVTVACIGPITADTAIAEGFKPNIIATEYTIPGLVNAMVEAIKNN